MLARVGAWTRTPQHLLLPKWENRILALACAACFCTLISWAWISDDGYITFRVIDNFVNGYGLRWNIDERVQVYTHPLWMLIQIPFYFLFRHIFLVNIALSAVVAAAGVGVLLRALPASIWHKMVLVLLPLTLSKAFRNHIINGLEAPLLILLLACFWHTFINAPQKRYRLMLVASLAMLTRLDAIVAIALPLGWAVLSGGIKNLSVLRTLKAWAPLWGWLLFALLYYGFMFPNTMYAKLYTGVPTSAYIDRGWLYYDQFTIFDRFGYLLINFSLLCAAATTVWRLCFPDRSQPHPIRWLLTPALMSASILLQIAYVIRVGGDFMDGRFFLLPIFMAITQIYYCLQRLPYPLLVAVCAGMGNVAYNRYTFDSAHPYTIRGGISNERHFYSWKQALFMHGNFYSNLLDGNYFSSEGLRNNIRFIAGDEERVPRKWQLPRNFDTRKKVMKTGYIGVQGYTNGPGLIIVDILALTDPLLARLPGRPDRAWRAGHFERAIPEGYLEARSTGDTSGMVKPLARYYEQLREVTSDDIFSFNRLKTVAEFQFGYYDYLKDRYVQGK